MDSAKPLRGGFRYPAAALASHTISFILKVATPNSGDATMTQEEVSESFSVFLLAVSKNAVEVTILSP
jgi:hypothetical protein